MLAAAGLLAVVAASLVVGSAQSRSGLVVHEWGTVLAMNGSDGVTLDGMYHEEHSLPGFVHARRNAELRMRTSNLKMETPVIYFYSDVPLRAFVEVKFPGGLWTQWFPQADYVGPSLVQSGTLPPRNGRIGWSVNVWPASQAQPDLPPTTKDALWNYTRDVDAAYVNTGTPAEWERFIFYRGLGETRLPLAVSATAGGRLTCGADMKGGLQHVYLLRVEQGRGAYRYLPSVGCGDRIDQVVPAMDGAKPMDRFVGEIADDLAGRLVESGLYAKEARAMVNTWRTSYFTTDGIRVLFVLPQSWTDAFIPMTINPAPASLVRVMVGRIEILTPEREREAETAISRLASPDPAVREQAFVTLRGQGRYVEPIVRRTLESTSDEQVRTLSRRLLLTDFVSDIRSALTDAEGRQVEQKAVYARAQLASLLREIGLDDQAKQEGERVLAELADLPKPSMADHDSRNTFRALARANEGAGRDAEALKWYGDFVSFGSGFKGCMDACHSLAGPRDNSFFRDWWVGRKYAELAWKTGEASRVIEATESALEKKPKSLADQLRLAYLYEKRGDAQRTARLWAQIDPKGAPQSASLAR
jgi:hypothetical protein